MVRPTHRAAREPPVRASDATGSDGEAPTSPVRASDATRAPGSRGPPGRAGRAGAGSRGPRLTAPDPRAGGWTRGRRCASPRGRAGLADGNAERRGRGRRDPPPRRTRDGGATRLVATRASAALFLRRLRLVTWARRARRR